VLLLPGHGGLVVGITFDIGAWHARPGAAKSAHARTDIKKERLALLFAVVADIDARLVLLAHDVVQRRTPGLGKLRIDQFAAALRDIELHQFRWPRQAPRVRGQNAAVANMHGVSSLNSSASDPRSRIGHLSLRGA
jgi:hypothetical protein